MSWLPIGPDVVLSYHPPSPDQSKSLPSHHPDFKRLSRLNGHANQGFIRWVAVTREEDREIVYAIVDPGESPASSLFRRDGHGDWVSIGDPIIAGTAAFPGDPNRRLVRVEANQSEVYVVTWTGEFFKSQDRGESWRSHPNGKDVVNVAGLGKSTTVVHRLLLDPRSGPTLYAASDIGLFKSTDGGDTWTEEPIDGVMGKDGLSLRWLTGVFSGQGTQLLATLAQGQTGHGLAHYDSTKNPQWKFLIDEVSFTASLPGVTKANSVENWNVILTDAVTPPKGKTRFYAWFLQASAASYGLYTVAGDPRTERWQASLLSARARREARLALGPGAGGGPGVVGIKDADDFERNFVTASPDVFAVAPDSPGDGDNDALFYGRLGIFRSVNGGAEWELDKTPNPPNADTVDGADQVHVDVRAITFIKAASGRTATYVATDGGIGRNEWLTERNFPTVDGWRSKHRNEGDAVDLANRNTENLTDGLAATNITGYACDPKYPALGYLSVWHSGITASRGYSLSADLRGGSESTTIALWSGNDGVTVWFTVGNGFAVATGKDPGRPDAINYGTPNYQGDQIVLETHAQGVSGFVVREGYAFAGIKVGDPPLLVKEDKVVRRGPVFSGPLKLKRLEVGDPVDVITSNGIRVTTTVVGKELGGVRLRAPMGRMIPPDVIRLEPIRRYIVGIGTDGLVRRLSSNLAASAKDVSNVGLTRAKLVGAGYRRLWFVAQGCDNPPLGERLYTTTDVLPVPKQIQWTEVDIGALAMGDQITAIAALNDTETFFLLQSPGSNGTLFRSKSAGSVQPEIWRNAPAPMAGWNLRGLVTHPDDGNVLYLGWGSRVLRLVRKRGEWTSEDIGDGLPGQQVVDLWVGRPPRAPAAPQEPGRPGVGPDVVPPPRGLGGAAPVLLRAALGSRCVFETTDPPPDAAETLYLRDSLLDLGWIGESPISQLNPYKPYDFTDPDNPVPGPPVNCFQCLDIKVDVLQKDGDGISFYQDGSPARRSELHHVDFERLRDRMSGARRGPPMRIHVQVNNRSARPSAEVAVDLLWCPLAAGLPELHYNNLLLGSWRRVGIPQVVTAVRADHPQVASWHDVVVPFGQEWDEAAGFSLLALIWSADSPLALPHGRVEELVQGFPQIGLRSVLTLGRVDDDPLGIPLADATNAIAPAMPPPTSTRAARVAMHNPTERSRDATIVFDLRGLGTGAEVEVKFVRGASWARVEGGMDVTHLYPGVSLADAAAPPQSNDVRVERLGPLEMHTFGAPPARDSPVYRSGTAGVIKAAGIYIGPRDRVEALVTVNRFGSDVSASGAWVEVQQWANGKRVGACQIAWRGDEQGLPSNGPSEPQGDGESPAEAPR